MRTLKGLDVCGFVQREGVCEQFLTGWLGWGFYWWSLVVNSRQWLSLGIYGGWTRVVGRLVQGGEDNVELYLVLTLGCGIIWVLIVVVYE
jgi:hypothetical protein